MARRHLDGVRVDRRAEYVTRRWRRTAAGFAARALRAASGAEADGRHAVLPFIGGPLGARMAPVADTDGEVRLATLEITGDYAWMSGMVTAVVRDGVLVVGARARLIRDSRVIAEDLRVAALLCENPELEFVTRLKAGGEGQVGCVLSLGCAQAIAGDVAETYIRLARGDRVDGDRLSVPGYGHDPLREEALGTAEIKDVIRGSGVTIARAEPLSGELRRHARARVVRDGTVVAEALRIHYSARGERLEVSKTPFSFTYRPVIAESGEDGDLLIDLGFADLRPGDHVVAYGVPGLPQERRIGLARVTRAPSSAGAPWFDVLHGSVPARCRIRLLRDGAVRAEGRWFGAVVGEEEFAQAVPGDLVEAYWRDGDVRKDDDQGGEGHGPSVRREPAMPQPVFDPELPADVRALLAAHPDVLEPAEASPPEPRRAWTVRGGRAKAQRLGREAHGRYLRGDDLDEQSRSLLLRAQTAVAVVRRSTVNGTGLLDDIRNAVALPDQEWEIARTLRTITELRAAQRAIDPERLTGSVTAVLRERQQALNTALASVTERVVALEAYAQRTRVADAAYAEWMTVQELTGRDDEYRELLARTVRDRLADEQVAAMTSEARRIQEALDASVRAARQAGEGLLPRSRRDGESPRTDRG